MKDYIPLHGAHERSEAVLQSDSAIYAVRNYTGIDWKGLIYRLLENMHWILLAAVICAVAAGLYVKLAVVPIYQATSKMYIAGSETTISLSDIQLGSSLAVDYQEAFKIWHVHEMVDERLGLDYSYGKLAGMVSVSSPSGSHVLYINIQSPDPQEAKLLADTYAEVVQEYITEKMELRRPQVLEIAQTPTQPISPNIQSSIVKAFAFGALLAAFIIAFLYLMDDRVRTSDDIEKATGLATLGVVSRQNQKSESTARFDPGQTMDTPHQAVIQGSLQLDYAGNESINTICSSIMFAGKNLRRIAITSCDADNGKTFLAIRIAYSMASRGKKVLLIDGDLRKSVMNGHYRITHVDKGLAHYLSGQAPLQDAIYSTNYENLFLLPVGELVKTPLPLLSSSDFEKLMKMTGSEFDMVIVDTPPIGIIIDAAEIAKHCDGSILVLEQNKQTRNALQYAQRIMEQTGTPIIGCVLNNVVLNGLYQKHYYGHYGSGYYYGDDKAGKASRHFGGMRKGKK